MKRHGISKPEGRRLHSVIAGSLAVLAGAHAGAQEAPNAARRAFPEVVQPNVVLNGDGSVVVESFVLPYSAYASPEARSNFERVLNLRSAPRGGERPATGSDDPSPLTGPWLASQIERYPVQISNDEIGGVGVQTFEPRGGVSAANRHRVLINLHGGGFSGGWPYNAQIESIPISAIGQIRVVSVNYRMFPEHRFPAASEDVERVYRELLRTYRPSQIGIYGCSAGGILTGQALAWLQSKNLPMPAAAAIFSAYTRDIDGDSLWVSARQGGILPAPAGLTAPPLREFGYFEGARSGDPMATPSSSPDLLAQFPPTLLATGTRAADMSGAIQTHLDLTAAGVDARLYLWDGLDHCFTYNPEMPESRQAYDITARFFAEAMDRAEAVRGRRR